MSPWLVTLVLAGVALAAPLAVGVVLGVDRQLNAALQRRVGPPLLQPWYDLTKLASKVVLPADRLMAVLLVAQAGLAVTALVLAVTGGDLVAAVLVLGASHVMYVLAASSVESPYAQMGASREVVLLVARDPLLLLTAIAYAQAAGSPMVSEIVAHDPLLLQLPTLGLTCAVLLGIALRKSPWDIASSHHGHQELVKGSTTEMAGRWLAAAELGHWYEVAFIVLLIWLAAGSLFVLGLLLVGGAWAAILLVDNAVPRATWREALALAWGIGGFGAVVALVTVVVAAGGLP
ncbi:MAG TPA: NADH-quinone oxidoreductase subunit H [Candidatus Limnocylindria bacterium]|jgi:formate hydrogenlyase subunit 4